MTDDLVTWASEWHPIAAESDLPYRHVFHGQLLGQELAVWRADDDHVNVWENRCLHRGVRLSIAVNDGRELKCQYHGWRYANRTAACTYIPAHPADAPARTITNHTYPVRFSGGMVWTSLGTPSTDPPELRGGLVLRGLPVAAQPADVIDALIERPPAAPGTEPSAVNRLGTLGVRIPGTGTFLVQPLAADRSVIRGVLDVMAQGAERLQLLRHFDTELSLVRRSAAERTRRSPEPMELSHRYPRVSPELATLPEAQLHRPLPTRVRVARAWDTAKCVRALELVPLGETPLPSGQPGAHLDVGLSTGLVRQYSLVNGPGETDRYVLGVRRTTDSAGGSVAVHEQVREGDVLAVSLPRNCFPLRQDREHTVLVAGGIGITPLLAMAQALHHRGLGYELHYFVADPEDVAFTDRLASLDNVRIIPGLGPEAARRELERLFAASAGDHRQAYLCGPPPMLDTARVAAVSMGWPAEHVRVEYFRNDREIDDSSRFDVVLARSVLTLTVEPGDTILETVRAAGVQVPSSCEQGACGSCRVTVIDGDPDHQDVYLSDEERSAGECVLTCVSRSLTPQLTLDL